MKKTYYYSFFLTKAEEEAAKARNLDPFPVGRILVEAKDLGINPSNAELHPWMIRKFLLNSDIITGKLSLSHNDIFDHVFRYWTLEMARHVVAGNRYLVTLLDFTEEANPKRYQSENVFVEGGPNDVFYLGWIDLARNRQYHAGDEVGLCWDIRSGSFHFKLLHRGT